MEKYVSILVKCPLFKNMEIQQLLSMLQCLNAKIQHYQKNQTIFKEGNPATHIGVVLSGQVQITKIDYYGNRSIVTTIDSSQIFGESFACADVSSLPLTVMATCDTTILLIDAHRILTTCSNACAFHSQIIFNLMKIIAAKNIFYNQKIEITSKRSTREKLIAFLLAEAKAHQSDSFSIPYNRQELADYLGVDRSGLSSEISKLQRAGLIESNRNKFRICKNLHCTSWESFI